AEDLTDRIPRHFLRSGIERGDGASCISSEDSAADTADDVFVKSLEPIEPLLFLTQRLIDLIELIRQGPAEQSDNQNGQGIGAERLKRRCRGQMNARQPPPVFS